LVSCVCMSRWCVFVHDLYRSQFKSNLHQTSHTQVGTSLGKNSIDFQGHEIKGQGHAAKFPLAVIYYWSCLFVCLSVSNFTFNHSSDPHKKFNGQASFDKKELIKLCKVSLYGCGSRNLWRILQHCKIGHFSTIWLTSLEKLIGPSWKF